MWDSQVSEEHGMHDANKGTFVCGVLVLGFLPFFSSSTTTLAT